MQGPPLPSRAGQNNGHQVPPGPGKGFVSATPYVPPPLPYSPNARAAPALPPPSSTSSSPAFVNATPYTLPPLTSQPSNHTNTGAPAMPPRSTFVPATAYVPPPLPSSPNTGRAVRSSSVSGGAPASSSFVNATPYTPPPLPSSPNTGRAVRSSSVSGGAPASSSFVSATPYMPPPLPSSPNVQVAASSSSAAPPRQGSFVHAIPYTPPAYVAPTPATPAAPPSSNGPSKFVAASAYTPPPLPSGGPRAGQPAAAQPHNGGPSKLVHATAYTPLVAPGHSGSSSSETPAPQPTNTRPGGPPGVGAGAESGIHRPSLPTPPAAAGPTVLRPGTTAAGTRPLPAARGGPAGRATGLAPPRPLPAQSHNKDSRDDEETTRFVPPPQRTAPAGPSLTPSIPALPNRPPGMAHSSSMPALPLPPNRPATTAPAQVPLSTGAPALPPAQHTRYPPPPPVVAAPNTDASSANRDGIMQARLDLFPLCLYGAELLSVTKGLATTFYEQRPISINVVLDPQMGVRLYGEGDARSIDLFYSRPAFCSNDKQFILRNGHDNRFFMLTLAPDTPDDVVGHMETILMCFCTMYKKVFTEEELKEIALHEDAELTSSKAARGIESGGAAVGKGMVKGAGWMGSGMRGVAGFVKDHTDSGHREVTEEERKKVESRAKTAVKFRKGVSMVSGAVAKGANVAGTGVAKAGHWGVEQYKETDYYKEAYISPPPPSSLVVVGALRLTSRPVQKQVGKEDEGPTKGDKAINVAKSSGAAIGNVWSGLVISTKIVASDVRESTADVVEHRRGKEHAELTRTQFNMAADVTVGGFKTFDLVSMYYKLVPKLALKVGAGALTYDPYKQDALHGIGWKEGWLKFEGNVREPWKPYYAVLKTYSFAWYKDELQEELAGYIPCREILEMKPISELQTKYKHSLQIVSKGEHQIVSLHCEGHPGWVGGTDAEMTQRGEEWMDAVMSLAFVQQKYRR